MFLCAKSFSHICYVLKESGGERKISGEQFFRDMSDGDRGNSQSEYFLTKIFEFSSALLLLQFFF